MLVFHDIQCYFPYSGWAFIPYLFQLVHVIMLVLMLSTVCKLVLLVLVMLLCMSV